MPPLYRDRRDKYKFEVTKYTDPTLAENIKLFSTGYMRMWVLHFDESFAKALDRIWVIRLA